MNRRINCFCVHFFISLVYPVKAIVNDMRDRIIHDLWDPRRDGSKFVVQGWWEKLAYHRLKEYETQLHHSCLSGSDSGRKAWSFWGALFFCATVFTTIGNLFSFNLPKIEWLSNTLSFFILSDRHFLMSLCNSFKSYYMLILKFWVSHYFFVIS